MSVLSTSCDSPDVGKWVEGCIEVCKGMLDTSELESGVDRGSIAVKRKRGEEVGGT